MLEEKFYPYWNGDKLENLRAQLLYNIVYFSLENISYM